MPAGSYDRVMRGPARKANDLHEPRQYGVAPSHAHGAEGNVTSVLEDDAKADAETGIHPHYACNVR